MKLIDTEPLFRAVVKRLERSKPLGKTAKRNARNDALKLMKEFRNAMDKEVPLRVAKPKSDFQKLGRELSLIANHFLSQMRKRGKMRKDLGVPKVTISKLTKGLPYVFTGRSLSGKRILISPMDQPLVYIKGIRIRPNPEDGLVSVFVEAVIRLTRAHIDTDWSDYELEWVAYAAHRLTKKGFISKEVGDDGESES